MVIFAMDKKNDDSNTNITDSVEPAPVGRQHEVVGQHYNDDDIPDRESNRSGSSSTSYNYPGDADIIMEIDMTEIKFQKVIGKGSFGVVYRALWAGKTVAVKKVETDTEVTAFQNEITQLSRVRHDNIIQMYGIGISLHAKCIIMEYANDGSLYQFLHCPPHRKYNLSNALSWLLQCAKAIAYLHSIEPRPIIHRDLKPLNLLLTNGRRVLKVCDFGTACDLRSLMTDNRGSTAWMAPEAIKGRNYNEKCDVYSWGLIMWELLTRRIPFEQLGQTLRIAWQVVVHRVRPPLIQGCPKPIERLMERCWQDKQSERPSMQEVVDVVYPLYRIMSGSEGDNLISSCYSSENSTAEGYASPLNGESTADHTSCDVSQITSSNNTFDYPPDVCKAPGQIPTPSSGAHLGPNSPYLHPDQGGPSRLGQGEGIGSRECWRVHPPDSISPDASANVLVGVENLLPPWGSAKSDDMPTSPASPAPGFLPPRRAFKGVKFPAEPILPLSISIPNGLHGLHPSEPFTSPWTFPVITAPHPILRPAPPTLTQAFAPPPHPPHIVSPPPIPEGTRVSLRPHSAGHDPSVVARRRSAEVPHSPHRGHRRSSSCESFELIGFEPLANELSRESRDAARSRLPFKSPVRTKDKFLTPEFGHMGGNWINEELGSSFEGPADEPTGPQAPHSASPYCLAASYSPEVAAQSRDVPSSILVASSGADTPLRINPPHFAQSPTKLGGDPRVPEEPAPSPHHEGTVPPTNTEREELGAFWQLLDDDLKPTMPHPTSPQSQQIFQEHKGLAHQLLVVQEEIVYLDKEKKRLLTKLEDQDREQQSCRQRYTDKIIQLKNKNESLRHDHSRLSQQLEEIRGRQKKEQASSPDSQPQLHHQPSSANSPVTLPSYFPPQHVQGGGQVPLQQQQHVPQPQYYYGPHHHHLYPYTHNP